jgi:hypothetical protein
VRRPRALESLRDSNDASDTMTILQRTPHVLAACIGGLLFLGVTMFVAMLAGVPPHPPGERGPYLGAVSALAVASLWMLASRQRAGRWAALATLIAFVPSVGPHKLWTEAAAQALAPLIVVGTGLIVTGALSLWRGWREE